ncbi:hypothetical protein [Lachnoclostridium sp. An138]|uniref:hypothetical protein n=1 Tax=Lachnoclostridium sp. An138 TaxID=1965560 RepID=UPI000B38FF14|nr:hypothetical protein [Lachnoclostridium sp. An138]OUQ13982.1 hypothetical protein B5E82_17145 [Lachnoclostridium sp. An138]
MSTRQKGQELFIRADKVMTDLQISRPLAYRLIKEWNSELFAMGYTTISGRIPRAFYEKKIYGMSVEKK